jgi:hypothetical protein
MSETASRLKALFAEAVSLEDTASRLQFLDRECAGNVSLRQEIDALLRAHQAATDFLPMDPSSEVKIPTQETAIKEAAGSKQKGRHWR